MHKLIYFIKKIYTPLIFFFLEIMALYIYSSSSPYAASQLRSYSHQIFGWCGSQFTAMRNYFSLDSENIALNERIAQLETVLAAYRNHYPQSVEAEIDISPNSYIAAKVVSNTLSSKQNYIVVNKGLEDNVRIGMSVLSPEGYAVGHITNCSQRFSIATSILNTTLKISARLSDDRSMCLAFWDGVDAHMFNATDISKYAKVVQGESVEAADFSEYFPAGAIIGTIESFEMNDDNTMYNCKLRLAADMSRLDNVILVDNSDIDEVKILKTQPEPAVQNLSAQDSDESLNVQTNP